MDFYFFSSTFLNLPYLVCLFTYTILRVALFWKLLADWSMYLSFYETDVVKTAEKVEAFSISTKPGNPPSCSCFPFQLIACAACVRLRLLEDSHRKKKGETGVFFTSGEDVKEKEISFLQPCSL